jgi:hypothetical protein
MGRRHDRSQIWAWRHLPVLSWDHSDKASAGSERGRGLRIVAALSAHWGWHPEESGKAIFATLAKEPEA